MIANVEQRYPSAKFELRTLFFGQQPRRERYPMVPPYTGNAPFSFFPPPLTWLHGSPSWLQGPPSWLRAPPSWLRGPLAGSEFHPAPSEALPAGLEALPALFETLQASPEAFNAAFVAHFLCGKGHRPLRGRCPLTSSKLVS